MFSGKVLGLGSAYHVWVVFVVSLIMRLGLGLLFQLTFGPHAVNHVETWFYVGVLEGIKLPAYGISDPTVWLLRAVGSVFPLESGLYGVLLSSIVLSALTAALVYVFALELTSDKGVALVSGLTYGGLVQPLGLTLGGFTHDHLQLPLMLVSFILLLRALKAGWVARIVYAEFYVILVYYARYVNESIYVAVGVGALYVGYVLFRRWGPRLRLVADEVSAYRLYLALFLLGLLVVGFTILPDYLERMLSALPQGRYGSGDVLPVTLLTLWVRYNIILFLIPFAALAAYGRRDVFATSLAASGLVIAYSMDRGARIADIGLAVLFAYAVVDWGGKAVKARGFTAAARWKTTSYLSIALFALMTLLTQTGFAFTASIMMAGSILLYALRPGRHSSVVLASCAVLFAGFAVASCYILLADTQTIPSETEYKVLSGLRDAADGLVLAEWDHGYMVETLSGLKAVSTPGSLDDDIYQSLWLPSGEAAAKLRSIGVKYILVNKVNPGQLSSIKDLVLASNGLLPSPRNRTLDFSRSLAYHIVAKSPDDNVNLISAQRDEATGTQVLLYEVGNRTL